MLARDKDGILQRVMMETVDGEYQNYKAKDGAYVRKHFFGKHPKLLEMVANMTDDDIWRLTRGGHDPHKIYAAFKLAQENKGTADRIAGQDRQGLRHGQVGRGAQYRAPDQEAGRRSDPRNARPFRDPDPGRQVAGQCRSSSRPTMRRK